MDELLLLGLPVEDLLVRGEAGIAGNVGRFADAASKGDFLDILHAFDDTPLKHGELLRACERPENPFYEIHDRVLQYYSAPSTSAGNESLHALAVAYLQLYVQCNYTGPELSPKQYNQIAPSDDSSHNTVLLHLECDGTFPYKGIVLPHLLLVARILFSFLCDPTRASWRENAHLDEEGHLHHAVKPADLSSKAAQAVSSHRALGTSSWWSARAAVLHARVLQTQSYETLPMLWLETKQYFHQALGAICGLDSNANLEKDNTYTFKTSTNVDSGNMCIGGMCMGALENRVDGDRVRKILQGMLWIEWGLCQHHFSFQDHGKKAFARAKTAAGLATQMSAALGKRTKYQREDAAQLLLVARSSLCSASDTQPLQHQVASECVERPEDAPLLEVGRRMVKEASGGEEAAMREVFLDSVDTGAAENIILEGGPHFSAPVDDGGALHPLDQAIILAMCLDVSNSNPADGLTNEEMQPYIERVLLHARNWMVHSTALLERSWIEYERRKTADRAMLQIQALIDQHTTKLTVTQSTYDLVESSAPAQQRLSYVYSLVYPSQVELKRDLAQRYLQGQVFMSALNYFRELEMWDDVVTCYQLLQKPQRAEIVVREQLRNGESPYMLTALADLTSDESLYERAWELSQHRYPRAKRTLAKLCFDRGDFAQCIAHMTAALMVQPMMATAWYLKGLACMRSERWEEGVQAFLRCVQQDTELGEAWANIGAIHMRTQQWIQAHQALTEAYKLKREDWKILENMLMVTMNLQLWKDCIRVMASLVDLRHKSAQPVHIPQLRYLSKVIVAECSTRVEDPAEERSEGMEKVDPLPDLAAKLVALFNKITSLTKSDAAVWDVVAEFYTGFGHYSTALDARLKQFRALISEPQWERNVESIRRVDQCAELVLASLEYKEATKADFYSCKMLLQSTAKKVESSCAQWGEGGQDAWGLLDDLKSRVLQVEGMISSRKL